MSKITLPTIIFQEETTLINRDLYEEIQAVVNKTTEDIAYFSENYVDENELQNYYKNQKEFFDNLSSIFYVYVEETKIYEKIEEFTLLKEKNVQRINLADEIAHLFEGFKYNIKPEIDLDLALKIQTNTFIHGEEESFEDLNYDELNRLLKIYLLKENLEGIDYKIEDGVLTLYSRLLQIKLTLCGEIENPQWKIFDINRDNKVKYLIELPPSIGKLLDLINIYEGRMECKEAYDVLINDLYFKKFIKGSKHDFEFDFILPLKMKVTQRGLCGIIYVENKKVIFKENVLKNYEKEVEKFLKKIDTRIIFSIKKKITIESTSEIFKSLIELNEYLFMEREERCFYSIFNNLKIKRDYLKEKFGNKNVCLLLNKSILVFSLVNLNYSNDMLKSTLLLKVFHIKSFSNKFAVPEELFIFYESGRLCINNNRNHENIKVNDFANFIHNFCFYDVSYSLFLYFRNLILFSNEIIIQKNIKITKSDNHYFINDLYCIKSLGKIHEFMYFKEVISVLNDKGLIIKQENDEFYCKYREINFNINFNDGINIQSENEALIYFLSHNNFIFIIDDLYLFMLKRIFPTYISDNLIIFNFINSFNTPIIMRIANNKIKYMNRNDFIENNFTLQNYNDKYKIIDSTEAIFFNTFKMFYYKDRFINLIVQLKKKYEVSEEENKYLIMNNSQLKLDMLHSKLILSSDNKNIYKAHLDELTDTFYKRKNYITDFLKFIKKYKK